MILKLKIDLNARKIQWDRVKDRINGRGLRMKCRKDNTSHQEPTIKHFAGGPATR